MVRVSQHAFSSPHRTQRLDGTVAPPHPLLRGKCDPSPASPPGLAPPPTPLPPTPPCSPRQRAAQRPPTPDLRLVEARRIGLLTDDESLAVVRDALDAVAPVTCKEEGLVGCAQHHWSMVAGSGARATIRRQALRRQARTSTGSNPTYGCKKVVGPVRRTGHWSMAHGPYHLLAEPEVGVSWVS